MHSLEWNKEGGGPSLIPMHVPLPPGPAGLALHAEMALSSPKLPFLIEVAEETL